VLAPCAPSTKPKSVRPAGEYTPFSHDIAMYPSTPLSLSDGLRPANIAGDAARRPRGRGRDPRPGRNAATSTMQVASDSDTAILRSRGLFQEGHTYLVKLRNQNQAAYVRVVRIRSSVNPKLAMMLNPNGASRLPSTSRLGQEMLGNLREQEQDARIIAASWAAPRSASIWSGSCSSFHCNRTRNPLVTQARIVLVQRLSSAITGVSSFT